MKTKLDRFQDFSFLLGISSVVIYILMAAVLGLTETRYEGNPLFMTGSYFFGVGLTASVVMTSIYFGIHLWRGTRSLLLMTALVVMGVIGTGFTVIFCVMSLWWLAMDLIS